MMKTTKHGFTLAEVLTTLMVIGVVAAMTIPTLMNSTNDQQLRVAYKKAMSVLGQAVQLMVAKEVECTVSNSAQLAQCFATNALSGSVVNFENAANDNNGQNGQMNVVTTADGMAYQFFYFGGPLQTSRTLDEICGDTSLWNQRQAEDAANNVPRINEEDAYRGENALCAVIVDVNGFSKGTKSFAFNGNGNPTVDNMLDGIAEQAAQGQNPAVAARAHGTDQLPIYLTGTGVRPIFDSTIGVNTGINKGYAYMYGDTARPVNAANAR